MTTLQHDVECENLPGGVYDGQTLGDGMPIPCHCAARAAGRRVLGGRVVRVTTAPPSDEFELMPADDATGAPDIAEALVEVFTDACVDMSGSEDGEEVSTEDLVAEYGVPEPIARLRVRSASTFADEGVLTMNAGVVLRLANGNEYQLTIVRSA